MLTIALAAIGAALLGLAASALMFRASNLPAAWSIAIGGGFVLVVALVLYVAVVLVERAAFGS
jgi:hypothetical protein